MITTTAPLAQSTRAREFPLVIHDKGREVMSIERHDDGTLTLHGDAERGAQILVREVRATDPNPDVSFLDFAGTKSPEVEAFCTRAHELFWGLAS